MAHSGSWKSISLVLRGAKDPDAHLRTTFCCKGLQLKEDNAIYDSRLTQFLGYLSRRDIQGPAALPIPDTSLWSNYLIQVSTTVTFGNMVVYYGPDHRGVSFIEVASGLYSSTTPKEMKGTFSSVLDGSPHIDVEDNSLKLEANQDKRLLRSHTQSTGSVHDMQVVCAANSIEDMIRVQEKTIQGTTFYLEEDKFMILGCVLHKRRYMCRLFVMEDYDKRS